MPNDHENLVASAELLHVGLVYSHFKRDPASDFDLEDKEKFMGQSMIMKPQFDRENGLLTGMIRSRVWVAPSLSRDDCTADESFESAEVQIETHHAVAFEVSHKDEISEAAVDSFVRKIGMMSIWPYFRSHSANLASEALVMLPPLPLKKARYPITENEYHITEEEAG